MLSLHKLGQGQGGHNRPVHSCKLAVGFGRGQTGWLGTGPVASAAGPCASAVLLWGKGCAGTAPALHHTPLSACCLTLKQSLPQQVSAVYAMLADHQTEPATVG